jgi:hypothetical protein
MDEALHVDSWHGGLARRLRRLLFLVEASMSTATTMNPPGVEAAKSSDQGRERGHG